MDCVCALTRPPAFCFRRTGKIQLNPIAARTLIKSMQRLAFRIVKEQYSFQLWPLPRLLVEMPKR